MPLRPTLEFERAAWAGAELLAGVDEVGRGPLAGPVVAAAVVFPSHCVCLDGVRDSKTVPAPRRQVLAAAIRGAALWIGLGAASVHEIDRLNIRVATALAMRRALLRALPRGLAAPPCRIVVDGLAMSEIGLPHRAVVDGDALCYSVAAAGLVAKTVRDALMQRLARRYPGYGWDTNMGYGTEEHVAGLERRGPTRHHRMTFGPVAQLGLAP